MSAVEHLYPPKLNTHTTRTTRWGSNDRQGFIQASTDAGLQRRFLNLLKEFTCDGVAVSSVAGCINDGGLCSDAGVCTNNTCICDSGREGQYCAGFVSASSSSDASTITIGSSSLTHHTHTHARTTHTLTRGIHISLARRKGAGAESWPLATFGSFFYRSKTMEDCNKAAALASFLYYSQTDPEAKSTADRYHSLARSLVSC